MTNQIKSTKEDFNDTRFELSFERREEGKDCKIRGDSMCNGTKSEMNKPLVSKLFPMTQQMCRQS